MKTTSKQTATDAFLMKKARIDEIISRLQDLSEEHFGLMPEDIHWGHVGSIHHTCDKMEETLALVKGWMPPKYTE